MKLSRIILLIFVVSTYLLLSGASAAVAFFRDDMTKEEAAELVTSAREKSEAVLEKRAAEIKVKELKSKSVITRQKKQVSPPANLAPKKAPSNSYKKVIIGLALFVIAIVIVKKFRKK